MSEDSTYAQVLRSSAITGGAQGVDLLLRSARTKVIAVLLGPDGVGLVALFQSTLDVVGTISGLGLSASGVRRVSQANAANQHGRLAGASRALMATTFAAGVLGAAIFAICAAPMSSWAFRTHIGGSQAALLGTAVVLDALAKGRLALLQGTQRIRDLAAVRLLTGLLVTVGSVLIYTLCGSAGIIPVFVLSAAAGFLVANHYVTRMNLPKMVVTLSELSKEARGLLVFGVAHMWGALVASASALIVRTMIQKGLGLGAVGLYQAAWTLSGVFSSFVLSAMAMDFYPRLTAVAGRDAEVHRLVDEQTEIALLLALPGILASIALGPIVIKTFFSSTFSEASALLPWLLVGVLGQVASWPVGFIQLAKGAGGIFAASQTAFYSINTLAVHFGLLWFGLTGVASAFAVSYCLHVAVSLALGRYLSGYMWCRSVVVLLLVSTSAVGILFALSQSAGQALTAVIGLGMAVASGLYSLRCLSDRLGRDHRISRFARAVPFVNKVIRWS